MSKNPRHQGQSDRQDFFRIGEQLGIAWFRLYLADSLAEKFEQASGGPPEERFPRDELLRWFFLHLAMQAGSGHLRTSLETIEEEMPRWYQTATFRWVNRESYQSLEFDSDLPRQVANAAPGIVEAGLSYGLIGQLPKEDSSGESLAVPRPPLVLTRSGQFIYFLRRRKEEDRFLAALERRNGVLGTSPFAKLAASSDLGILDTSVRDLLQILATGRCLILLSGGPGTGKTTTVARLLEYLKPTSSGFDVLLAAPTGRAAARMSESLKLSDSCSGRTLHSLLGLYPGKTPGYNADNPLTANLCIVDEASMVDLPLMNILMEALPESAALLLVGDPDQLPSVEAGAVLGDLLYGAEHTVPGQKSPLAGAVVQLTTVYRSDTAILEAATAVREGNSERLKAILAEDHGKVRLHASQNPDTMARIIARKFQDVVKSAARSFTVPNDISSLFADFSAHAVVSPLRQGPHGVPAMNERISWLLGGTNSPFPGMPVMITRNDRDRNLWNGDRGVIVLLEGKPGVAFPDTEGVRIMPLTALPGWEPAWVQTIHKSQGSEFDAITIVMPEGAGRLLSREILYTAFTRARHTVDLYAEFETVEEALQRRIVRHSRIREWAAGKGRT